MEYEFSRMLWREGLQGVLQPGEAQALLCPASPACWLWRSSREAAEVVRTDPPSECLQSYWAASLPLCCQII